ncbi:hypothetical protein [Streptomyces avidinii]|uniref:CBS domain protein n=1 Tax=Streptomyces avidinii TaxID=1895 RepID=A0ABS4KZ94_STRAV|nr:hypothetical protein [Streptomyces avidinii]MBP2035353.1 hypothetical protein [Streptomyces avidinii]GGZ03041.1 hypothetical protein GCM10010343_31020 [Streptomyces avidinii]
MSRGPSLGPRVGEAGEDLREGLCHLLLRDRHRVHGHTLVGIVALADIARALPDAKVGDVLEAISHN